MDDRDEVEEDANTLTFGPEFTSENPDDVVAVSNAEVALVLGDEADRLKDAGTELKSTFHETLKYVKRFSSVQDTSVAQAPAIDALRRDLVNASFPGRGGDGDESKENERTLDAFEVAALTNINPDDADEAKSLIPSLGKFEDDEIEDLLKIISSSAAMAT